MITDKNIVITGGAGFIANALLRRTLEKNRITVFDNFHRDTLSGSGLASHPNLRIVRGDVLDYPALCAAM
jgi:UDP-glucose 4-epimerase